MTAGLGLIITAGVGAAVRVPVAPQIGTVPAISRLGTPLQFGPPVTVREMPRRLALPTLGVDAPIVPVRTLPNGGLAVPDDSHVLGWWQGGARPGAGRGSVVIDGHVDTAADGPGTLFSLRELRPGDPVVLGTDHGARHYVIAALRSYAKAQLPAEVFDPSGQPRLVIITCGGSFNKQTRQYSDNVVAYAVPASARVEGGPWPRR
jgi:hypothetical protein